MNRKLSRHVLGLSLILVAGAVTPGLLQAAPDPSSATQADERHLVRKPCHPDPGKCVGRRFVPESALAPARDTAAPAKPAAARCAVRYPLHRNRLARRC